MAGKWETWDVPAGILVLPEDDIIEHSHNEHCACDPEVETIARKQNSNLYVRKLIIHNAMDGREDA